MDEIERAIGELPSIAVNADDVRIIETPHQFYQTLVRLTREAKERVVLSTLYLGNGALEQELVSELAQALQRCAALRMNILIDYLRGTRDGQNSSAALLKRLVPRASVHLFHTPHLRGLLKKTLPERTNEIVGLQHMKLYVFDDHVIISGANLSDSYFTDRQDRYVLIENSAALADFCERLVAAVSSCSFALRTDGSIRINPDCTVHPYREELGEYGALVRSRISEVMSSLPPPLPFPGGGGDTRVYPLLQMGVFGLNQENDLLVRLLSSQDSSSKMVLTSGYFNLIDHYAELISERGRYAMDIIYASPQANGFHGACGISGYVPSLYTYISEVFYRRNRRANVRQLEYERAGWSYHAKGLWIDSSSSPLSATLVGSSNYGYRSVHRDLEAQLLLVTSNQRLKHRLRAERSRLLEWSVAVDGRTFMRPDHAVPKWVRLFARHVRNFF